MNFFKRIYRYYAPEWMKRVRRSRLTREQYQEFLDSAKGSDCLEELEFIRKSRYPATFPYPWFQEYRARQFRIYKDGSGYYCPVMGKKVYLPESAERDGWGSVLIAGVMAEQDARSPHLYFSDHVSVEENSVFFDIGAAEGLVTLLNIDKIKKAYLFECEDKWTEALKKTFEPYKDKVTIINKYVSSTNDENHTTLEGYLEKHKNDTVILKMDIEGMETEVVPNGLGEYMGADNIKFSLCTYHKAGDAEKLKSALEECGYSTEFSQGHMVLMNEKPYFRKGIIRAWK